MSIDSAVMKFNGEDRHFDPVEAKHVRALMDLLSVYAVESTVWWDQGKGEKTISLPSKYALPRSSDLSLTVSEGSQAYDIPLK